MMEDKKTDTGRRFVIGIIIILSSLLITFAVNTSQGAYQMLVPFSVMQSEHLSAEMLRTQTVIAKLIAIMGAVLFGFLADIIGRGKILAAGIILLGLSLFVFPLVESAALLGVVQIGTTLGSLLLILSVLAYMLDVPGSEWFASSIVALYQVVTGVGRYLAPAGAGWAMDQLDLRTTFWVMSGVTLVGGVIGGGLVALGRWSQRNDERGEDLTFIPVGPTWKLRVALILLVAFLIGYAGVLASINSYELYHESLGLDLVLLGTFSSLQTLLVLLTQLGSGLLADLVNYLLLRSTNRALGREIFLALGLVVLVLGRGLSFFARSSALVGGAAIATGIGVGIIAPQIVASLVVGTPRRRLAFLIGIYLAATELGLLLGQITDGLFDRLSPRTPFLVATLVSGIALFAASAIVVLKARWKRDAL